MIKVLLACCVLGLTLLTAPSAQAASSPKAGDCYAKADLNRGVVDLSSKVDCTKPHAVQLLNVASLPQSLRSQPKVPQSRESNGSLTRPMADLYVKECRARKTASGIWPSKGKAVAAALEADAATFRPEMRVWMEADGSFYTAFLPDQKSWDGGSRNVLCGIVLSDDAATTGLRPFSGDMRSLESARPLSDIRVCANRYQVPCSEAHQYEALFTWEVAGFPSGDSRRWTDQQWAPYRAQCQSAIDVLVGAKRADLTNDVSLLGTSRSGAWGREQAQLVCSVKRTDGSPLPPGTVVGLGNKPL